MVKYFVKRVLWIIPVSIAIAILIFTIMYFTPGDPASTLLGADATDIQLEAKREELGLNDPYIVQLGNFLVDVFIHFDLGTSYVSGRAVIDVLMERMPRTLMIAVICMCLQVFVGTPLGIYAATHQNKIGDRIASLAAIIGVSMPNFWLALMLVLLFSVKLGWLPSMGIGGIKYYILPCIACSLGGIASQERQTRSAMLEVIRSDYITTARAKGLSERDVLIKHALPNALIPLVTVVGHGFGMMLSGAIIVETVFSIPGVGTYMMSGITQRDYPVVRGSVIFLGILFSLIMVLVDLAYAFIDPRIKAQFAGGGKKKHGKK